MMKRVGIEKKSVVSVLEKIDLTTKEINDLKVLYDLLSSENSSEEEWKEFEQEFKKAKTDTEKLYAETLYDGEFDNCPALLELHSGAGGEEAQDWTDMLHRMYLRYAHLIASATRHL